MGLSNMKLLLNTRSNLNTALIYVCLAIATLIALEPVRHNDFISYDDRVFVTENPHVQAGLTRSSLIWAFTTNCASNWHPVTWLSHMTDCALFGLNPAGHHLTSLLFHIANALLLFGILKRMTGRIWPSFFVAAAFALHPLRVESVAWVSDRNHLLSAFFGMLAIAAYQRYAEKPGAGRYLLTLLALCLSLMSKPMLVTLPFVFLLLDYWPMGRFQWAHQKIEKDTSRPPVSNNYPASSATRLIAEKIPFFLAATISCVVTYSVKQSAESVASVTLVPISARVINALTSYVDYIVKAFYPVRLAFYYPYPAELYLGKALLLLAGIPVLMIRYARQRPWLRFGLLWYLGTLVPVIGLVQVWGQAMADRYTYLPLIGIFIIVAWGAAELAGHWRYASKALPIVASAVLVVLLVCTRRQVKHWRDSITLYRHTVAVTRDNFLIQNSLANALLNAGSVDEALPHLRESVRINPKFHFPHYNLGRAFLSQEKLDEAAASFKKALELKPDHPYSNYNMGVVMTRQGKHEDAIEYFKTALRLKGNWAEAYSNLGLAYTLTGKYDLAIHSCNEALRLRPDLPAAINNLNTALQKKRKTDQAIKKQ